MFGKRFRSTTSGFTMEYPEPNWGGWRGNKRRKKRITDPLFFFWNSHSSSYAKAEFKNCFIIYLRTFAPIATAIFWRMSRTRHASQTTKVNTILKAQTFSTRMERESRWHDGIAVDPGLLGNVTQWRDSANIPSLRELRRDFTLECSVIPIFLSVDHFLFWFCPF